MRYVADRADRAPAMEAAAEELKRLGRTPYVIPIGASTPLGAAAFVDAITELREQIDPPDVIVHSTSSGGTQAGLVAGCAIAGWKRHASLASARTNRLSLSPTRYRTIIDGLPELLGVPASRFSNVEVVVDDRFVGGGYGVPTADSTQAIARCARTEAIFLDPTYTAKAMAGLIARYTTGDFASAQTVLFWHTGGQVALFA